jgi:predicted Zn-dependent protease
MRGQERPFLAWIGVARASVAMGDLATADLAVAQAIQVDPGSAASTDLVGRTVLMIARDRGEAGRSQALMADAILSRAERLDPELPNVAYHRGLAHLAADDPRGAVILLERATATDPANQDVRAALVLAYKRVGARVGDGPASR